MATANNKTSVILEQQFPDFIREEYATFIAFLKSYYEYLELSYPPVTLPFIIMNPDLNLYTYPGADIASTDKKVYGTSATSNNFIVGEKIIQKANRSIPDEITGSATVFTYTGNATSQTAVVTTFGGTQKAFVKRFEIVGEESGVVYWPEEKVSAMPASASRASLDIFDYKNIDETLDDYIQYIKNETAVSLPGTLHEGTDRKTVIKNIRDFYRSRGSENSFKLLFRILYGEDAEIYFPQEDMLRPSDGEWRNITILRTSIPLVDYVTGFPVTVDNIVGRKIKQEATMASALVEKAIRREYLGVTFAELELSSVVGTFGTGLIQTDNIGDGTSIEVEPIKMLTDVNIVDGGSNYKPGDLLSISGGGTQSFKYLPTFSARGAIAKVATTNSVSGAVASVEIVEPGLFYTEVPTLDLSGPHSADAGAARFAEGPLDTIFYNDFSQYTTGNTFLAESDNRGASSNVGGVGDTTSVDAQSGMNQWYFSVRDPVDVTANSYANFMTVPGAERGLKGWWRMNSYHPFDVRINSQDGLLSGIDGGNTSPTVNTAFIGPQVGDVIYMADRNQPSMQSTHKDYFNPTFADEYTVNTYSSDGWFGFQPVVFDESGQGHHARVATHRGGDSTLSTANLYSEHAFANAGIFGAGSGNSFGTFDEGGLVLMTHDDIRHDNEQSWVFWFNPYEHDTYSDSFPAHLTSLQKGGNIITRDLGAWAISLNNYSSGAASGEYTDVRFTFGTGVGAEFDNTNTISASGEKLANSSGLFPGSSSGGIDAGGALKIRTWNMIALTLDYNNSVGNVYFFNTDDGLLLANGFTIDADIGANTYNKNLGWQVDVDDLRQGRAVVLGERCESANGDMFSLSGNPFTVRGGYDEVRYYNQALTESEIINLFRNPGGKFDNTLSGDWAIQGATHTFRAGTGLWSPTHTANVEFLYDNTTAGNKVAHIGDADDSEGDGLRLIYNKNIPYDPHTKYKMSVRAKDGSVSTGSNAEFGIIGVSNTGSRLLGTGGVDDWSIFSIALGRGGVPAESGNLGPDWPENHVEKAYVGVFGGSTTSPGLATSGYDDYAHGGNTAQGDGKGAGLSGADKVEYTWASPSKLYGATGTGALYGNTVFFRPILTLGHGTIFGGSKNDETLIDYVEIEQARDATLTGSIGSQFKLPGKWLGDSGKLSTSPQFGWVSKYLQDDHYYQAFSYVIKSGLSLATYKEVIKKLAHPAGTIMFAGVDIQSEGSVAISTSAFADLQDLILKFFLGAESSILSKYADIPLAGRGVGYRTGFGLKNLPPFSFDLNTAHGTNPHGAGNNVSGSPGWIAWNESPSTSPFANSHYYGGTGVGLWPYDSDVFPTSNAYTTVTSGSLIWHVKGERTSLVSAFQNANTGALLGHADASGSREGTKGWYQQVTGTPASLFGDKEVSGFTQPLDIDGGKYRYVRMKVRRIGPGGYGDNSWFGACQADTNPPSGGSRFWPGASGGLLSLSANTISQQPSTFVIPADALLGTKSPWHILEWDMHNLGQDKTIWKDATASTGPSPQDGPPSGTRVGSMAFYLCEEPDNKPVGEKFEIEWIQVDDGTGWPRGSYPIPAGYVVSDLATTSGAGTGGMSSRLRTSESTDISEQTIGDLSATVVPGIPVPSVISTGAPVLYVHSEKKIVNREMADQTYGANGAIFRVSANTANNLDWVVTEVIDSEKFLENAPGQDSSLAYVGGGAISMDGDGRANGKFSGPVILDTDRNDNLYVGYLYESGNTTLETYPGFTDHNDPKPLMLFRLTPTDNAQSDMTESADPHNLRSVGSVSPARGRSNTYSVEQILWGNVGGVDGVGVMIGGSDLYETPGYTYGDLEMAGTGSFVDFSTDDLGSLYVVGSGSQNVIKILPAANGSYANGLSRYITATEELPGRKVFEIATTTTIDANTDVLGNWRPQNIIPGPKDSLFVACDTGYSADRGANSVYCYHIVTAQNTATGEFYAQNVYPVYANTRSREYHATLGLGTRNSLGLQQTCAGMVLDHEDPPNLYYMTANTMYRIKPKGYSYQIGDTEIEQVFPERYFEDVLGVAESHVGILGRYRHPGSGLDLTWEENYAKLQIDGRGRIYFPGYGPPSKAPTLYCYSRGPNTSLLLYDASNTEFSTLQVVVNTYIYTSNIDWNFSETSGVGTVHSIDSFVIGASSANNSAYWDRTDFGQGVYFTAHTQTGAISDGDSSRLMGVVYPNSNGSFVLTDTGQQAFTIMDDDPASETKFATDGTGGANKYRGTSPAKIVLRPEKL